MEIAEPRFVHELGSEQGYSALDFISDYCANIEVMHGEGNCVSGRRRKVRPRASCNHKFTGPLLDGARSINCLNSQYISSHIMVKSTIDMGYAWKYFGHAL